MNSWEGECATRTLLHEHFGQTLSKLRVRRSLHRVDPAGIVMRTKDRARRMERRPNIAPHFGFTWSIDQNEKLIDYGVCFYMGIDSYSRFITFFGCSPVKNAISACRFFRWV